MSSLQAHGLAPEAPRPLPTRPQRISRHLALLATVALALLCVAWEGWLVPVGHGTLALKALPLLLPLVGLWRYRLYTFRALSLFVWLYALEGLVRATSEPGLGAVLATAEVLLSVVIFTACAMHVRQRLAAPKATPAAP
ncbi:DUF2069 domain-containing protein [Roseateles sp. SL47]|uniref:DUF2069 domain-containing protein n=1 Tax=Roseateles sp. SL47 TaxID=2995138 RepID=UPI00226EF304|nr:DUF2069 domain-containing protein [Roseateles sp. SL47]WAC71093.1 DUF2069 domain-containing protein [Roseateles sp. SL47]